MAGSDNPEDPAESGERIRRLEAELLSLRDRLQASVDERRDAEARQRRLLGELQHRVPNTMAVIRQIAKRTAETADSVEDYAAHLDGRINALARTQSMLTRIPGSGVSLRAIVDDELLAHAAREDQATVDGPEVLLQAKAAETLGLAVHELATNSIKYGALAAPGGRLAVVWRIQRRSRKPLLRFEWRETGLQMMSPAPRRRGFGLTLIEQTVPYELAAKAKVAFLPGELACMIEMPLNKFNGMVLPEGEDAANE